LFLINSSVSLYFGKEQNPSLQISIYIYKNGSVVCRGLMEIQNHASTLMNFHAHPRLSKEGFGAGLTPTLPPGPGRPETIKAEGQIF